MATQARERGEHQSTVDQRGCLRVLGYLVRVWERWARKHADDTPLPAAIGVVVTHAPEGWTAATELHALVCPLTPSGDGIVFSEDRTVAESHSRG